MTRISSPSSVVGGLILSTVLKVTIGAKAGASLRRQINSEDGKNKELSYPAMSETPNGDIDVCFSYHRRAIAHIRIPVQKIGTVDQNFSAGISK